MYQWQLKYFLGRGEYFRHWQLRNISDKSQVLYFVPERSSLLLTNCLLVNNRNIAQRTYGGANRQPCAWVKAQTWTEVEVIQDLGECQPLFYNPKIQPYWQDAEGKNIDGCQYETVITSGNRVYGIPQVSQTCLFELEKIDSFDTPEAIADLANMLTCLDCAEGLKELQQVPEFTSQRLNQATKTLSPDWQNKIRQWAISNRQLKS